MISYQEALHRTLNKLYSLEIEQVDLVQAAGRVVARNLVARVDSPSVTASLKDGYAVQSADIAAASPDNPVELMLIGRVAAGGRWSGRVKPNTSIRILTGAPIPSGADAVLADEFADAAGDKLTVWNYSEAGRNILVRGSDVRVGQVIVTAGERLTPPLLGLLAAGGHARAPVVCRPRVALLATGDEVLAPGKPLPEGKLYASNMVTLAAWCEHYGFATTTRVAPDQRRRIREELIELIKINDMVITCGGAWKGDRDLVVGLLDEMNWEKIYHRVRLGPGKAVGFGLLKGKPVFCLPGGPPSNQMAFLQLALPGLQRLAGQDKPGLERIPALLGQTVSGQEDWTQCLHGRFEQGDRPVFVPLKLKSRLQEMAQTEGILMIPEGVSSIEAGTMVMVQRFPIVGGQS